MEGGSCDEIAVVEAIYDVTLAKSAWFASVTRAVASNLRAEQGGMVVYATAEGSIEHFLVDAPPELAVGAPIAVAPFAQRDPAMLAAIPPGDGGIRGFVEEFSTGGAYYREVEPYLRRAGVGDSVTFFTKLPDCAMIGLSAFHMRELTPTAITRRRYATLAKHMQTAWRLREQIGERLLVGSSLVDAADAVLDTAGVCHHAVGPARDSRVLRTLRGAILARESARGSRGRVEPDRALALWPAVIEGRWILVDHVELDGRRVVLAVSRLDGIANPRALNERERQVVLLVAQGATNAEIAYEHGLSEGGVAAHLHAAQRKLKCRSRAELIRFARAEERSWALTAHDDSVRVAVERARNPSAEEFPMLSASEVAVLTLIRAGHRNKEIAASRGTSVRTIANQVASILRKTGRRSRHELVAFAPAQPGFGGTQKGSSSRNRLTR